MKVKGIWASEYSRIVTPLNIIANWRSNVWNLKKSLGSAFSEIITIFEGNKLTAYLHPADFDRLNQQVAKKTVKNKEFVNLVDKEIKKSVKNLLKISQEIYSYNLDLLSNKKLMALLDKFILAYAEIFAFGLVTSLDRDLNKQARAKLEKKFRNEKIVSEYFTTLSAPYQKTIYRQEEEEILRLAVKICKDEKVKQVFRKKPSFIKKGLENTYPLVFNRLNQLTEKYNWLYVNYEGAPRTVYDFIEIIQTLLFKEKIKPDLALNEIKKKDVKLIKKQRILEKKLKPDDQLIRLFRATRHFAYLREYRKPQCVKSLFYFRKLIREIAKRLQISPEETKFLLPQEIKKALRRGKINRKEIKKRMRFCVLYNNPEKEIIFVGGQARKIVKNLKVVVPEKSEKIKGVAACPGLITGKANVIFDLSDLKKFKKGSILVAKATSPDFVGIMKKAKAVVTDEGGMTSHAAIISRELGISCIVGTKTATKSLKTGDLIEVDAYSGTVKKLK